MSSLTHLQRTARQHADAALARLRKLADAGEPASSDELAKVVADIAQALELPPDATIDDVFAAITALVGERDKGASAPAEEPALSAARAVLLREQPRRIVRMTHAMAIPVADYVPARRAAPSLSQREIAMCRAKKIDPAAYLAKRAEVRSTRSGGQWSTTSMSRRSGGGFVHRR